MSPQFMDFEYANFFAFLDDVRRRGDVNMLGTVGLIEDRFDLDTSDARYVLVQWISTYNNMETVEQRVRRAYEKTALRAVV